MGEPIPDEPPPIIPADVDCRYCTFTPKYVTLIVSDFIAPSSGICCSYDESSRRHSYPDVNGIYVLEQQPDHPCDFQLIVPTEYTHRWWLVPNCAGEGTINQLQFDFVFTVWKDATTSAYARFTSLFALPANTVHYTPSSGCFNGGGYAGPDPPDQPCEGFGIYFGGSFQVFDGDVFRQNSVAYKLAVSYGLNPPKQSTPVYRRIPNTGKYEPEYVEGADEQCIILASYVDKTNILVKYKKSEF